MPSLTRVFRCPFSSGRRRARLGGARGLYRLLQDGLVISTHLLPEHMAEVCREMDRYRGRHVDFADACLMVLSDSAPKLLVVTLDTSDFSVYLRVRTPRMLISPNMG